MAEARGNGEERRAYALMREMGSKSGFTPIPPDQHKWQKDAENAPIHRIWAWMVEHTCHWSAGPGRGSAHAVDREGKELHIEHVAADLFNGDLSNARRDWKMGVARGLWRYGNKDEGSRKLFIAGEVRPVPELLAQEEAEKKVCTNLLADYILKELKKLPAERQQEFGTRYQRSLEIDRRVHAVFLAGSRLISDQKKDSLFREFGLEKRRLEAEKTSDEGHATDGNGNRRGAEIRALAAPLLPEIERFVQTIETSYKVEENTSHEVSDDGVQNQNGGATLLPAEKSRGTARAAGSALSEASGSSVGPAKGKTPSQQEQKQPRPWHQFVAPEALPEFNSDEEKQARSVLFDQFRKMQLAFKHADFSKELITPHKTTHELLIFRVMKIIRPGNEMFFCVEIAAKFKGFDRNGLAKMPPRSPDDPHGPRSMALMLDWAVDFAERRFRKAAGGIR